MDAAAHPAGEAFAAQPEAPPAPAKPAEPPALEPGAQWKALPYKLRKKIANAVGSATITLYVPPLMAAVFWANTAVVYSRREPPESKLLMSNAVAVVVAMCMGFLVFTGYQYLRYIAPNKAVLWDGIRGYYHKWRTHRNNARTAVAEMVADPALRPKRDVRTVASIGRDALVFGALALLFALAAACLLVCHVLGVFETADSVSEPLVPGEVFLLVTTLAAVVLSLLAVGKAGGFVSAWRRFVFASARRGVLGWWREFSASDDWKRFVSIRPTFAFWRSALFVVLLSALVWGTHEVVLYATRLEFGGWRERSKDRLVAVCPMRPFTYFGVTEIGEETGQYEIDAVEVPQSMDSVGYWMQADWYHRNAALEIERERYRKAALIGWTCERMAVEIEHQRSELEALRKRSPLTADEFEAMLEPLQMEGFEWKRKESNFFVETKDMTIWYRYPPHAEVRADFDGGRLIYLQSHTYGEENFESYDFAREYHIAGGTRWKPIQKGALLPLKFPSHLIFWLAVFAFGWSLLLAPFIFLRFTCKGFVEWVR